MRLAVLSLLCLFVACFQEPPADRMWRCTVDKPQCPEGQSCVNDWCVKDRDGDAGFRHPDGPTGDMIPLSDGSPIGTKVPGHARVLSHLDTKASMICLNGYKLCVIESKSRFNSALVQQSYRLLLLTCLPGRGSIRIEQVCWWTERWIGLSVVELSVGQNYEREHSTRAGISARAGSAIQRAASLAIATISGWTHRSRTTLQNGVLCCPP